MTSSRGQGTVSGRDGKPREDQDGRWRPPDGREHRDMEITLRNLVSEEEVQAIVEKCVAELLDRTISFAVMPQSGEAVKLEDPTFDDRFIRAGKAEVHECEICGQANFASSAALGGHKYWKHGVTKNSDSTPDELKEESRKRTSKRWKETEQKK